MATTYIQERGSGNSSHEGDASSLGEGEFGGLFAALSDAVSSGIFRWRIEDRVVRRRRST